MPAPDSKKRKRRLIPSRRQVSEEARRVARSVLAEHRNDADAAIADLADQTHTLRLRNRQLRSKLPKEGEVLLTGDQVKLWEAVTKLDGATPESIAQLASRVKDLENQLGERSEQDLLNDAHEAAKFPRAVLADLKRARGLKVEVKSENVKVQKDGKEVIEARKVVYVTEPGEGKAPIELKSYIEANAPEYKDKFGIEDNKEASADSTTRRRTFTVNQPAGGDGKEAPAGIDKLVEQNAAAARAPNPLRPAKNA